MTLAERLELFETYIKRSIHTYKLYIYNFLEEMKQLVLLSGKIFSLSALGLACLVLYEGLLKKILEQHYLQVIYNNGKIATEGLKHMIVGQGVGEMCVPGSEPRYDWLKNLEVEEDITGYEFSYITRNAPNLKSLRLNWGSITPLPSPLHIMACLEELEIYSRLLSGEDFAALCNAAPNLKKITLSCDLLTQIPPASLGSLSNLATLIIPHSGIPIRDSNLEIILNAVTNLKVLEVCKLPGNLEKLDNLRELSISYLDFTEHRISDLVTIINRFPNLKKLPIGYIRNLQISDLVTITNAFPPNLEYSIGIDQIQKPLLLDNATYFDRIIIASYNAEVANNLKLDRPQQYQLITLSQNLSTRGRYMVPMELFINDEKGITDITAEMRAAFNRAWRKLAAAAPEYGAVTFSWVRKGLSENQEFKKLVADNNVIINRELVRSAFLTAFNKSMKDKRNYTDLVETPSARQNVYKIAKQLSMPDLQGLEDNKILPAIFDRVLNRG